MKVSRRALVPPFAVMDLIAEANRRRAEGRDVISLCAGEPSSGAAPVVRERAATVLATSRLGYTEALGSPALRAQVAAHYRRWYGLELDPQRVAITTGSSGGFLLAFLSVFDAGDRVVLARPGYPAYRNVLAALGCEVVELDCGPASGYRPTVEALGQLEGPVAGLVVASPANPTGTTVDAAGLEALAAWCAERGAVLVSDEIYHGITYDADGAAVRGAGAPTAACLPGAVVVSSFSKFWAMTGWRLGWLVLPEELCAPVDALAGNLALCPPALAQEAALAAFTEEAYEAAFAEVERYAVARRAVLDRLPELGWTRVAPADGAFYLYADVSTSGLDSREWCARLLAEADVALTPGTDFDPVHGHDWVRLSFAADPAVVGEAVDRIVAWQAGLGRASHGSGARWH